MGAKFAIYGEYAIFGKNSTILGDPQIQISTAGVSAKDIPLGSPMFANQNKHLHLR